MPGPGRAPVRAFLRSGSYLFAASDTGSVFRSANSGDNWTRVNNGLTPRIGDKVYSLAAIGTTIFAGTAAGVFRSTNNGDGWTAASAGLPNRTVKALVVNGTMIFAGTTGAVFRSTDNEESWTATGALQTGGEVETLIVSGTAILRVKADGSQAFEPMARFDPAQNRFVSIPVDLGPDLGSSTDQVFLVLFGTGFRFRAALSAVSATIGGTDAQVLYADFAPNFVGLDQVNLRLPRSLAGRGEIDVALTVEGKVANAVKLNVK